MSSKKVKMEINDLFEKGQIVEFTNGDASNTEKIPTIYDPEWTDFMISKLHEDEMWEGIPRIDGLRRLVETYISKIKSLTVEVIPVVGNDLTVIAKACAVLEDGSIWTACSDASTKSTTGEFRNKLTSMADSRAKSKLYREILRLANLITSEELSHTKDPDDEEQISGSQIAVVKNLIQIVNKEINVDKLIKHVLGKEVNIDTLKFSEGAKLIQELSDYKGEKPRKTIPSQILNSI